MLNIRIVELPPMRAVASGPIRDMDAFSAFGRWFTEYHAKRTRELSPRDFMWYNEREGAREWIYALPEGADESDTGGFPVIDCPFGLYAVASCLDADLDEARDWLSTRQAVIDWVNESALFRNHINGVDAEERYPMFHIVSPHRLQAAGVSQEDLYVPIHLKAGE